jgi:hypothetical protein
MVAASLVTGQAGLGEMMAGTMDTCSVIWRWWFSGRLAGFVVGVGIGVRRLVDWLMR